MFTKIFVVLVAAVGAFLGYVAMQPSDFRVTRTAVMHAPPAAVFAQYNDFHNWQAWSPWAKKDPNAEAKFEGPSSGTGAIFRWKGNSEVGEGSMTIVESRPNELVRIRLDFLTPFQATHMADFTFTPEGEKTSVSWSMYGTANFIGKVICTFMSMDNMVGKDFEAGLASVKAIVEKH